MNRWFYFSLLVKYRLRFSLHGIFNPCKWLNGYCITGGLFRLEELTMWHVMGSVLNIRSRSSNYFISFKNADTNTVFAVVLRPTLASSYHYLSTIKNVKCPWDKGQRNQLASTNFSTACDVCWNPCCLVSRAGFERLVQLEHKKSFRIYKPVNCIVTQVSNQSCKTN